MFNAQKIILGVIIDSYGNAPVDAKAFLLPQKIRITTIRSASSSSVSMNNLPAAHGNLFSLASDAGGIQIFAAHTNEIYMRAGWGVMGDNVWTKIV